MFIERATLLKISPRPSGAKHKSVSRTICRKHCAPLEREYRVHSIIYKHLAPLERKRIPLLHLEVEFTTVNMRKNFLDELSNSVRPFDYMVKAGQPALPKTKK